jgi:hypothetical protein
MHEAVNPSNRLHSIIRRKRSSNPVKRRSSPCPVGHPVLPSPGQGDRASGEDATRKMLREDERLMLEAVSDPGWSCSSAPEHLAASDTSEYTRFFAQGDNMIACHGETFRLPEGPNAKHAIAYWDVDCCGSILARKKAARTTGSCEAVLRLAGVHSRTRSCPQHPQGCRRS